MKLWGFWFNPYFFLWKVDYILGDNPLKMAYMVGYGSHYPKRIHHRGSSLPCKANHPQHIPCSAGFQSLYSSAPNPNILVGAVVGGQNSMDRFPDDRNDYEQSEPSTYINAPFVGSLAYLDHSTMPWSIYLSSSSPYLNQRRKMYGGTIFMFSWCLLCWIVVK